LHPLIYIKFTLSLENVESPTHFLTPISSVELNINKWFDRDSIADGKIDQTNKNSR